MKEPLLDAFWDLFRNSGFYGLMMVVTIASRETHLPLLKTVSVAFVLVVALYLLIFWAFWIKGGNRSGY